MDPDTRKFLKYLTLGCAFLLTIIGICVFLAGCNPFVRGGCPAYDIGHGTPSNMKLSTHANVCCGEMCVAWEDRKLKHCIEYACPDATCFTYDVFYATSAATCWYATNGPFPDQETLNASALTYANQSHLFLVTVKGTCHGDSDFLSNYEWGLGLIITGMSIWVPYVLFLVAKELLFRTQKWCYLRHLRTISPTSNKSYVASTIQVTSDAHV